MKIKIVFFLSLMLCSSVHTIFALDSDAEYERELKQMESQWQVLHLAYQEEQKGDLNAAILYFQKALPLGDQSVPRIALKELYEKTGQNEKALEQVEWLLKGNQNAQGRQNSLADKQRLLQKIEARKQGAKIDAPKPSSAVEAPQSSLRNISDFNQASQGDQKKFMEKKLPEDTEVLRLSKQAMLAEHSGDFKGAKEFYEQLLVRKEGVRAAYGEVGWVMLHAAVQRTSEVTGDGPREKEMLLWIRDNMLALQGPYHKYLRGLLPPVQDHLKERLNKFDMGVAPSGASPGKSS